MYNLNDILQREEQNKQKAVEAQQQAAQTPDMNAPMRDDRNNLKSLAKPFQQMASDALSKPMPKIDRYNVDELDKNAREQYIQSFDKWSDAEKDGSFSQQEWANQRIKRMVSEGKNPGDYLNVLSLIGDSETPEERQRRERREALGETFRGLGNLIGSAANLYYTNKGGKYIDLNTANEKHRERMQRIKDKQDALAERQRNILINAKLGDLKAERLERAADKKLAAEAESADLKNMREMVKLSIQNAYKLGQIDAKTAADLEKNADKAKTNKELETLRQKNRVALKTTPTFSENKILTSLTGADGNVYTRNSKLDNVEIRELAKYVEDWSPYTTVDENGKETIDYIGAIADAAESGMIPVKVLEQRGYKKGKSSKKSDSSRGKGNSLGIGIGKQQKNVNKLGIGL